jgi:hypothetical protein
MQKIIFAYYPIEEEEDFCSRSTNPLDYKNTKVAHEGEDLSGFLESDGLETLMMYETETVAAVFLCEDLPHGTRFTLIA